MDKALSITMAILMVLCFLALVWLASGGFGIHAPTRSLGQGITQFGGPLGFWGGLGLMAAVGMAVYGLHELCNLWAGRTYVRHLMGKGLAPDAIAAKVDVLPLSRGLKKRMKAVKAKPKATEEKSRSAGAAK